MLRVCEDVSIVLTLALGGCFLMLEKWYNKLGSMRNEFYGESLQKYRKTCNICLFLLEVNVALFVCGFILCLVFAMLLMK